KKYAGSGSDWVDPVDPGDFNSDGTSFNAGDDAVVVCYDKDSYTTETTEDFTSFNSESGLSGDFVFAGAYDSTNYYVISKSKVYSGDLDADNTLSEITDEDVIDNVSGNFSAIAGDTNNGDIFLATDEGEVLYYDGTDWSKLDSTDREITSMAVVEIDIDGSSTDFLIIGTKNGYLEADISDPGNAHIEEPTSATADTDTLSSSYPSLTDSTDESSHIFDVHAGSGGVFYLATGEGLWKRDPDEEPMIDKM
ncbi:MAG: hypothetical protein R6V67_03250, partial [Spirochaetia bacterium]